MSSSAFATALIQAEVEAETERARLILDAPVVEAPDLLGENKATVPEPVPVLQPQEPATAIFV